MSSYDLTKIFLILDWKKEKAIFLKWRSFHQHYDHHHSVEVKVSCVRSCDFNSIGAALVDEKIRNPFSKAICIEIISTILVLEACSELVTWQNFSFKQVYLYYF